MAACIVGMVLCIYRLKRNREVYKLRTAILNDLHSKRRLDIHTDLMNDGKVYSYDKMFRSFKPMDKLEQEIKDCIKKKLEDD